MLIVFLITFVMVTITMHAEIARYYLAVLVFGTENLPAGILCKPCPSQ